MKFLIIRLSSIGDIVLTTPVLRCLKLQMPNAQIHYLTKHAHRQILEANPYISKIHLLHESLTSTIFQLKQEGFDYIIDLHNNLRTFKIKRALKNVPAFSFNKLNYEKWLLVRFKINKLPTIHIVDRYLQTLQSFGIKNDGNGLDYFIPKNQYIKETDLPISHQAGFIGIAIGATLATKKLPLHQLKKLASSIVYPIILLGGPEDKQMGDEIAATNPYKIYNACGKFSIHQSADLVCRSKLLITHDTGLMHIAAALKKPIISIWGNTVPEFGMGPYFGKNYESRITNYEFQIPNKKFQNLPATNNQLPTISCRPCSKIGFIKCPKGHFKCMEMQDTNAIAATVSAILQN